MKSTLYLYGYNMDILKTVFRFSV